MTQHAQPAIAQTEPTATEYAEFGRYAAALLGSHAEWDDPGSFLEDLAMYASTRGVQGLGTGTPDDLAEWRRVADALGVEHDGEADDEDEECGACGANLGTEGEACESCDGAHECARCDEDLPAGSWSGLCVDCQAERARA